MELNPYKTWLFHKLSLSIIIAGLRKFSISEHNYFDTLFVSNNFSPLLKLRNLVGKQFIKPKQVSILGLEI